MIKKNRKMQKLLDEIQKKNNVKLEMGEEQLEKLLNPSFKMVQDCIVISERETNELEKNFEQVIMEYFGDRTGYEASATETRINDFFQKKIPISSMLRIVFLLIPIWADKISKIAPMVKVRFVVSSSNEEVILRFHQLRNDEPSWLIENLEDYNTEAVGYIDYEF